MARWGAVLALALSMAYRAAAIDFENLGLNLKLEPGEEHCLYEDVKRAGSKIYFSFAVSEGGHLDVDLRVDGPGEHPEIYLAKGEASGKVLFKAPEVGTFSFCFDNRKSSIAQKSVHFNLAVGDPTEGSVKLSLGPLKFEQHTKTSPMERSVIHLTEGLKEIRDDQDFLRTRERIHRDTVESTNTRVLWWSVAQGSIMVISSVLQVVYLKKCFEVRRQV